MKNLARVEGLLLPEILHMTCSKCRKRLASGSILIVVFIDEKLDGMVWKTEIECCGTGYNIPELFQDVAEAQKFILQFEVKMGQDEQVELSPAKPYLEAILQSYGFTLEDAHRFLIESDQEKFRRN